MPIINLVVLEYTMSVALFSTERIWKVVRNHTSPIQSVNPSIELAIELAGGFDHESTAHEPKRPVKTPWFSTLDNLVKHLVILRFSRLEIGAVCNGASKLFINVLF